LIETFAPGTYFLTTDFIGTLVNNSAGFCPLARNLENRDSRTLLKHLPLVFAKGLAFREKYIEAGDCTL